uniref:Senescence regulator S40 n=1 Tax=Lotus japonicus TaxID=34305 RepID=I3S5C5_LOTJA|nr:unknown [Lotus japonicus]
MEEKQSAMRQHSGIWKSLRDGDFEEEEIWDVLQNKPDSSSGVLKPKEKEPSPLPAPRPIPTASRMIPRRISNCSSNSASSSHEVKILQQSAPVNIPDWSKVHRNDDDNNQKKAFRSGSRFDSYDAHHSVVDDEVDGGDSDEDDEYDSKLPPHEFIAKRLARSHISSFSVLEGVGRTLKGRDLSKLRNAVLTRTGFLE